MRPAFRALPLLLLAVAPVAFAQPAEEPPPGEEPGPGAPPPPGDASKDGDVETQRPTPARPSDAPDADAPPKGEEGQPTSSVMITFEREIPDVEEGVIPQGGVEKEEHVTFKGTATCKGCTEPLLLMVERHSAPDDKLPYILTTKRLTEAGDFELLVPKVDEAVILHLLVDKDNSGAPTRGERSAMLELGGTLIPNADRDGLNLDATPQR